jgi:hypothetical protein
VLHLIPAFLRVRITSINWPGYRISPMLIRQGGFYDVYGFPRF